MLIYNIKYLLNSRDCKFHRSFIDMKYKYKRIVREILAILFLLGDSEIPMKFVCLFNWNFTSFQL